MASFRPQLRTRLGRLIHPPGPLQPSTRSFRSPTFLRADEPKPTPEPSSLGDELLELIAPSSSGPSGGLASLGASLVKRRQDALSDPSSPEHVGRPEARYAQGESLVRADNPPHNLHVVCSKHNTHLTLTRPDHTILISLTAGSMGFRKAQRGLYDAAFQASAEMMRRISSQGLLGNAKRDRIDQLNLVFRGFMGQGRDAFQKVLLGTEGRFLRPRVVSVTDATRLKIGGSRSPNPRRLG